jgi:hypothetical protein
MRGANTRESSEPGDRLNRQSLGMLAMLNQHEGGGGALDLARLAHIVISREEAEAALGTSAGSDGRLGIDLREFLPDLPDSHIVLQAAKLGLAARAALKLVAADDAELAELWAESLAQLTDDTALARQAELEKHQKAVELAYRRGVDPPKFVRPEPIPPDYRFERAYFVNGPHIMRSKLDPRTYLEPHEHTLLAIRERRTTLAAEKRDLERMVAAADARVQATMTEVVTLVESVYTGFQPGFNSETVDIGPAWSACSKLQALTTEQFAMAVWGRAITSFRRQFEA